MSIPQLLLADCTALVLLVVTASFTRATRRRLLGALVAGIAVALLNVGQDALAHSLGWWSFPFVDVPYSRALMYLAVGLWYGAGVALIGWRVTRRFGRRGVAVFLCIMGTYGPVRDYAGGRTSGAILFGPGLIPVLADGLCWMSGMALGQTAMRLVAGPAWKDPPARLPKGAAEPRCSSARKDCDEPGPLGSGPTAP